MEFKLNGSTAQHVTVSLTIGRSVMCLHLESSLLRPSGAYRPGKTVNVLICGELEIGARCRADDKLLGEKGEKSHA